MLSTRLTKALRHPSYLLWGSRVALTQLSKRVPFFASRTRRPTQQTRAVMFHIGRSGSTMLADLLNQNREIAWCGELAKCHAGRTDQTPASRFSSFREELEADLQKHSTYPAYGFEIKPFHIKAFGISAADFIDYLNERGFTHFLILERKNYLRKIVSSLIALQTGMWHSPKNVATKPRTMRFPVRDVMIGKERKALIDALDKCAMEFAQIRQAISGQSHLELTYERDAQVAPTAAAQKCYDFLNAKRVNPSIRYGRTNPHQLSEVLENADEVKEELRGTAYEWMYDDAQ